MSIQVDKFIKRLPEFKGTLHSSATEFQCVGTEQTTCFGGILTLLHNEFKSSRRAGEWKIRFESWEIYKTDWH